MIPLRRRKRRGGEERCIVFRGSKICRPLILFSDWKMRQRTAKDEKGGKRRRGKQNKYLNVVRQAKVELPFLSHFPLRWRTRQPLRLRDCSVRRAPSPTRYHFYSLFWRAFRISVPSHLPGGIRLRSGRDKLQGCTGTLFENFLVQGPVTKNWTFCNVPIW